MSTYSCRLSRFPTLKLDLLYFPIESLHALQLLFGPGGLPNDFMCHVYIITMYLTIVVSNILFWIVWQGGLLPSVL